jgi:alanine-glyoxylate transaminase / serine-glyoxylate transaminase / serine-pyruvate transaminase
MQLGFRRLSRRTGETPRNLNEFEAYQSMDDRIGELLAPTRLMMTPGPCSIDPRVYRALSTPLVGHMDPWFTEMIGEVQMLLRKAFQTENRVTFPISASGSGGIEAAVVNPLEPGDEAIICVNGNFSERMAVIASRTPSKIHRVEAPLGRTVDPEDVRRAGKGRKIKFIGVCHGETSTGVISPIDDFRKVADELGTMLVVDAVATLVGTPLNVDQQRIDLCFSGSQKAISAPPGMAPITVGPRMEETLRNRKTPVQSWYFDLTTTMNFWGKDRTYHHTPPISIVFALREALRIVFEEGLEASWQRHKHNQLALIAGLEALGLDLFVPNPDDRLATVTSIKVPAGADDLRVRQQLLSEFGIEIAGGIGPLKGKIWRVGLMGYVSQAKHILFFLAALEKVLLDQGFGISPGVGVGAAIRLYSRAETAAVAPRA